MLVGISVVVLPYWTFQLMFTKEIVNDGATNKRDSNTLAKSGDIYGIIEMSEFGNAVSKDEMKVYFLQTIENSNFRIAIFPHLSFLQQFQIMEYLYKNHSIQVKLDTMLMEKFQKRDKQYKYKLGNDVNALCNFLTYLNTLTILQFCTMIGNRGYSSLVELKTQLKSNDQQFLATQSMKSTNDQYKDKIRVIIGVSFISIENFEDTDGNELLNIIEVLQNIITSIYFNAVIFGNWYVYHIFVLISIISSCIHCVSSLTLSSVVAILIWHCSGIKKNRPKCWDICQTNGTICCQIIVQLCL